MHIKRTASDVFVNDTATTEMFALSVLDPVPIVQVIQWLQAFFTGQWVYVSGNLLLYYVRGDPKRCVSPDVFVVKDCDPKKRRIYKVWEEGKGPNFGLEVTSSKTRAKDRGPKMQL